jgi:hypothetical protein
MLPAPVMIANTVAPLKDLSVCFPKRKNQFYEIAVSHGGRRPTTLEDDAWHRCTTIMAKVRDRDDAVQIAIDYANNRFSPVAAVILR